MVTCLDLGCLYIVWVMVAGPDHESLSHIKIMVSSFYIITVYEKGHGLDPEHVDHGNIPIPFSLYTE